MAISITSADEYISLWCVDNEDWLDGDEARKQRILNVAERGLRFNYPKYTIPDAAVYEYANALSIAFNDVNKNQQAGIAGFSVTGVASFTFKDWAKTGLDDLIPESALQLIGEENGIRLGGKRLLWTVL